MPVSVRYFGVPSLLAPLVVFGAARPPSSVLLVSPTRGYGAGVARCLARAPWFARVGRDLVPCPPPRTGSGGRGWGGVTDMLGTSMSPQFSPPITATSSVDGSVTLPVCTRLPRGVGLAVIGPPFAGGPVFLTCRPSMLRRWLDTTSAFLGVQSTIDAFYTQHAAFSRASSPESISRVHFCSYASRGPPLVGRWWSLRWLRSFRPIPVSGGMMTSFWGGSALRLHPLGASSDAHGPFRGDSTYRVICPPAGQSPPPSLVCG